MNTEKKILEAAFDHFSDKGFEATTTKIIAEEAGVNEVTLFRHFDSKMDLFHEVVEQQIEEEIEMFIEDIPEPTGDIEEDMMKLGMKTHDAFMECADFYKLLLSEFDRDPELFQAISDDLENFVEAFSIYLEEGKKRGKIRKDLDTEVAAFTFLSFFLRAMAEKAFLGEGMFFELDKKGIRKHVNIFLEGIENES